MTLDKAEYEQRLVLFIDFLGFRELINRTETDVGLVKRIISAMNHIKDVADESEFSASQRVTQFSDCMVVSYRVNERSAVFDLINNIGFVLVDLAGRGFLLRGAVTVGSLLHDREHLLGPAMITAYELESKVAKFPRVIVDSEVLKFAKAYPARQNSGDEELKYVSKFLREDGDGRLFVDYISWVGVVETIGAGFDAYPEYLSRVSDLIRDGLANERPDVKEKYLWLWRHYRKAIKEFEDTPPNYSGRLENPEFYDDVLSLPRFSREVSEAERVVAAQEVKRTTPS